MIRSITVLATCSLIALAACADSGSSDSGTGLATLASVTPEPAGANCAAGGTRISTGIDVDNNGVLDAPEVKTSQYVCNGANGKEGAAGTNGTNGQNGTGAASLLKLDPEGAGSNCGAGGTRIQSGPDTNANGTLDASEITATRYVCNGATGATGANSTATDAVTVYNSGMTNVQSTTSVTVIQATIAAPSAGKVVAFSNADTFCASPATGQGYDCNGNNPTTGYYTLTTDGTANGFSGNYDYFFVSPNATENTARTAVFDVAAAGNVTVYLRARTDGPGQYGFFRTSLTLLFIP